MVREENFFLDQSSDFNGTSGRVKWNLFSCNLPVVGRKVSETYAARCCVHLNSLPRETQERLLERTAQYVLDVIECLGEDFCPEDESFDFDKSSRPTHVARWLTPVEMAVFCHEFMDECELEPAYRIKLWFNQLADAFIEWVIDAGEIRYIGEACGSKPWSEREYRKFTNYAED